MSVIHTAIIADDDEDIRQLVVISAKKAGIEIVAAVDNGLAAWDAVSRGGIDLAILDGEATPTGGMGIAKQLKDELEICPPLLVLTGRPDDAWLATWSRAEAAVPHPIDPIVLGKTVLGLLRAPVR